MGYFLVSSGISGLDPFTFNSWIPGLVRSVGKRNKKGVILNSDKEAAISFNILPRDGLIMDGAMSALLPLPTCNLMTRYMLIEK